MNNKICITIGDINGIGIEILLLLFKQKKINNFILFTNKKILEKCIKKNKFKFKINIINSNKRLIYKLNELNIFDYKSNSNSENILKSIKNSYFFCKKYKQKGIITLPVNKNIVSKYKKFSGHTEFFENLSNNKISNMIFIYNKFIISSLTTHIRLKNLNITLSKKNFVYNKIISLNKSLKNDFNISKPKILISGINPHSGENGLLGNEEKKYLIPQIKKIKKLKINITGPISGDAMLNKKNIKKYDCFLFMFHDQALIPFKYISNYQGVNYTSNLDIIRVSPDHGTAYDLVGKNIASNKSMLNCFKIINKINRNQINCTKLKNH